MDYLEAGCSGLLPSLTAVIFMLQDMFTIYITKEKTHFV